MSSEKKITHTRLQADCFQWHWNEYVIDRKFIRMLHNNPRNAIDGAHLKAAGMRKGTPDMVWWRHSHLGDVYFEFKTGNDRQKKEQKEVQEILTSHGHLYFIIETLDEYKAAIFTTKYVNDRVENL